MTKPLTIGKLMGEHPEIYEDFEEWLKDNPPRDENMKRNLWLAFIAGYNLGYVDGETDTNAHVRSYEC